MVALATAAFLIPTVLIAGELTAAADTPDCGRPTGALNFSAPAVTMGDSVTLSWGVTLPSLSCSYSVSVSGPGLAAGGTSGSVTFAPATSDAGTNYGVYSLQVRAVGVPTALFSTSRQVTVNLPGLDAQGRRRIDITRDYQTSDFVRAVAEANADVNLAPTVNLNLTYRSPISIEHGVHITGGRSSTQPGARLYTTAIRSDGPEAMFWIGRYLDADGVRINGVRIDGGDMGIAGNGVTQDSDPVHPVGILADATRNLEIGNSEIYGWSGNGILLLDDRTDRLTAANWDSVWIHDNYIHHNQRYRTDGYGVRVGAGVYAVVERNVFDYNRHSIESAPEEGTSYRFYNNLVLPNGGVNSLVNHTHVVDVHGTYACDGYDAYCGPAGEYYDFRHNALWYTASDVLKVRGTPRIGADVVANAFSKAEGDGAIVQTEGSNLWSRDNQFSTGPSVSTSVCDFDGDARPDDFVATGVSWWYRSAASGQYFYLASSRQKLPLSSTPRSGYLTAVDPNGDGRCDIYDGSGLSMNRTVAGAVRLIGAAQGADLVGTKPYSGPTTPGIARLWQIRPDLTAISSDRTIPWLTYSAGTHQYLQQYGKLLGRGDFNGDGAPDLLWQSASDNSVYVTLLDQNDIPIVPGEMIHSGVPVVSGVAQLKGVPDASMTFAGLGDFTGDGRTDILWRASTGELWLWPAGQEVDKERINFHRNIETDEPVSTYWTVKAIGDFNGDGYADIQWRYVHDGAGYGQVDTWYLQGNTVLGEARTVNNFTACQCRQIQQVADFDGDGRDDTLWRDTSTNALTIWFQGRSELATGLASCAGGSPSSDFQIVGAADFTGDGKADIVWRHFLGVNFIWRMSGASCVSSSLGLSTDANWNLRGASSQAHERMALS
ncbi:FG-GAP-like repeat-containing protein [Kribbella sp. NPDC004536]|uniref:FG-GAP-like repeat-containing protein n=1 Tax=Kribbella sp. NPDC004536 TaxID=3364106 RepID=UPI0036BE3E2F